MSVSMSDIHVDVPWGGYTIYLPTCLILRADEYIHKYTSIIMYHTAEASGLEIQFRRTYFLKSVGEKPPPRNVRNSLQLFFPHLFSPNKKATTNFSPLLTFGVPPGVFGWRLRLSSFVWTGDDWFQECLFGCTVYPIPSMSGIFTYIWLIFMVNVGKYTIHG